MNDIATYTASFTVSNVSNFVVGVILDAIFDYPEVTVSENTYSFSGTDRGAVDVSDKVIRFVNIINENGHHCVDVDVVTIIGGEIVTNWMVDGKVRTLAVTA